jgi:hypothetical protein
MCASETADVLREFADKYATKSAWLDTEYKDQSAQDYDLVARELRAKADELTTIHDSCPKCKYPQLQSMMSGVKCASSTCEWCFDW